MLIRTHPERCMASGRCRALAGAVFGADPDGWVALLRARPGPELHEAVLDAAVACPTGSIEVRDDDGVRLWPE